jgi:molybdopterin molybdotransferase
MISVSEARMLVKNHASKLPSVVLPLSKARGLVLASQIMAPYSIPAYPQSSMDGFAFAYDIWKSPLKLVGTMAAGSSEAYKLKAGEAVRIFTGAAVPEGADTVLMQEKARVENGMLLIEDAGLTKGANVRPVGSEITKGEIALPAGTLLTPAAIGFLAGIGITEVTVTPLPTVSIIVTGNELQTPGEPLEYGQVYEANSFTLLAALGELGIKPLGVYHSGDDPLQLTEILLNALEETDVVLITGGVSVGDYDFTEAAFDACGVEKVFHKIKQKPGKPLLFGVQGDKLVFGLPGNPASVLSCYYQYVLTGFSVLANRNLNLPVQIVPVGNSYKKPSGITHFLKGHFYGEQVELLSGQESYKLNSFAKANCLAEIDEDVTEIKEGDLLKIHLFN